VQDRPDAWELLAALRMFLTDEVTPAVPSDLRFGIRVAINVCAMLEREARLGERPAREEVAALAALLDGGEPVEVAAPEDDVRGVARQMQQQLARAIRAGEMDERLEQVVQTLRERLAARLAVAHPGWESFSDNT
jgi:Domain of unknown function (DUF6285)